MLTFIPAATRMLGAEAMPPTVPRGDQLRLLGAASLAGLALGLAGAREGGSQQHYHKGWEAHHGN